MSTFLGATSHFLPDTVRQSPIIIVQKLASVHPAVILAKMAGERRGLEWEAVGGARTHIVRQA